MAPIPLLPQTTTHLSSQGMQRTKDFTEHLLGEVGAAAPLQATVTDARETKLSDSSHDTFAGRPRHSEILPKRHPLPSPAFVAQRLRKNIASHLERALRTHPLRVTDKECTNQVQP